MTTLADLRAACEAATPGPWELGDRYAIAGVKDEMFGKGKCTYCRTGDPIWQGKRDINGTRMLAHVHLHEPYSRHEIVHYDEGDVFYVCGNYDYETGGVCAVEDATFIALARTWLPALVDVAEAAQALLAHLPREDSALYGAIGCNGDPTRSLRAALDRLEGL